MRYVGKKLVRRAYQMQTQLGSVTNSLSENLGAAKEVRAFSLESRQAEAFGRETSALIVYQLKAAKYAQALTPAIEIISAFGVAVVFIYAYRGHVTLDAFIPIMMAVYISYEPVKKLGAINNEMKRGEAALNRLEVVFNEPVSIKDPPDPVEIGRLRGDIAFQEVALCLQGRRAGAERRVGKIPAGDGLRPGGSKRGGKDHLCQPGAALL